MITQPLNRVTSHYSHLHVNYPPTAVPSFQNPTFVMPSSLLHPRFNCPISKPSPPIILSHGIMKAALHQNRNDVRNENLTNAPDLPVLLPPILCHHRMTTTLTDATAAVLPLTILTGIRPHATRNPPSSPNDFRKRLNNFCLTFLPTMVTKDHPASNSSPSRMRTCIIIRRHALE